MHRLCHADNTLSSHVTAHSCTLAKRQDLMALQAALAELQQQLDLERQHRQQLQQQLAANQTDNAPPQDVASSQEHAAHGSVMQLEAAPETEKPAELALISHNADRSDTGDLSKRMVHAA